MSGIADQDDGWGDFDLYAGGAAPAAEDKEGTMLKSEQGASREAEALKPEVLNLDDGWGEQLWWCTRSSTSACQGC